jgi:bacteriorhodopsin
MAAPARSAKGDPARSAKVKNTGFRSMPSLFRFLIFVGVLGALGYGAVFALANFVQSKPREIVVTVPQDKFLKPPR